MHQGLVARTGVPVDAVDEVFMGNCLAAGLGMNPARQADAVRRLGEFDRRDDLEQGVRLGHEGDHARRPGIRSGEADLAIAGGFENMSRPPYLLLKAREGYRMGNSELYDALIYDGLTDAFHNKHMGVFADACAAKFGFTRQAGRLRRP